MLQIQNIRKQYRTGELVQNALKDVSLNLRDNEFVAVLGPSGSGKTTLLNIIGGLDRYDSGDLIINGISTKKYKDRDWDSYRNHTIGFVFQSYNLIPHQSILSNVELALTISGVPRSERKERAQKALEAVGLGEQSHKRPNQLSGGQMQRVAIARALVNDPDVVLADEPTGALDSETSIQVMELLKEVAKDRLVVMVTHNPELAEQYATRIVKLKDGEITGDTDPFTPDDKTVPAPQHKNMGKAQMSVFTSLALSFNNLRTKKGRTLLTAFAGSIGIIGIALILSLSTGVNQYITDVQKDTMASYPLTISETTIDLSGMMNMHNDMMQDTMTDDDAEPEAGVHADYRTMQMEKTMETSITENNLTEFKNYLDDENSEIQEYLGENGVVYSYDVKFDVYAHDADGKLLNTNVDTDTNSEEESTSGFGLMMQNQKEMMSMMTGGSSGADNFSELTPGADGEAVSRVVTDHYALLYGKWAENYDETVLVLNRDNSISAEALYQLGILNEDEFRNLQDTVADGKEPDAMDWDYEDICDRTFLLLPACDRYEKNDDGTFTELTGSALTEKVESDGLKLKITGIVRLDDDPQNAVITTPVAYTAKLTDYIIRHTNESAIVKAQEADENVNVLNGMAFEAPTDEEKAEDAKKYVSEMGVSEKASLYQMILYYSAQNADGTGDASAASQAEMQESYGDMSDMGAMSAMGGAGMSAMPTDETSMAQAFDNWLENTPDEEILVSLYDQYIKGASYADNMESFGKVSYDAPSSISIYTDSFENKEAVSDCIDRYNANADEENKITYTDYVALLTSSVTSIVNVISYVLIAFVAVSLIVSGIMIGIITHISVLERTKEIGILRALGASKANISQVFNAETVIIGFCAGLIGVGISALLTIPINAVIAALVGSSSVRAILPLGAAVILVVISVIITMIGGLLPAKSAAKKDPVLALRSE